MLQQDGYPGEGSFRDSWRVPQHSACVGRGWEDPGVSAPGEQLPLVRASGPGKGPQAVGAVGLDSLHGYWTEAGALTLVPARSNLVFDLRVVPGCGQW